MPLPSLPIPGVPDDPLAQQLAQQKMRQQPADEADDFTAQLLRLLNQPTPKYEPTEREKQQQGLALTMMLTGKGRGIGDVGQVMYGAGQDAEKSFQQNADRELQRKMSGLQALQMTQDRKASREQLAAYRDAQLGAGAEARAARVSEGADRAEARAETEALRREAAAEKERDRQIQNLSNKMAQYQLPGLITSAGVLTQTLSKYPTGDIPGIGPVENVLPDFAVSEEGQMLRSDLASFANQLLMLRSGAAVTDPEMRRFLTELARGGGVEESVFRARWPKVLELLATEQRNLYAGAKPEAVAEYMDRGGMPIFEPSNPFEAATPAPGDKYIKGAR